MQVLGPISRSDSHKVAASVTLRVSAIDSTCGMEWLMNVSHVVNEKSQSLRPSVLFVANLRHHCLIDEVVFVVITGFREPLDDLRDGFGDVIFIKLEAREVR